MQHTRTTKTARGLIAGALAAAALAVPMASAQANDDVPYCGTTFPKIPGRPLGDPIPGDPVICPQCGIRGLPDHTAKIRLPDVSKGLGSLVGQR